MQTVRVEIPSVLRPHMDGNGRLRSGIEYRTNRKADTSVYYGTKGSVESRFKQHQQMGGVQAIIQAFEQLDCNAIVRVEVKGATYRLDVDISVGQPFQRKIVRKALEDIERVLSVLQRWPEMVEFTLGFTVKTVYLEAGPRCV